VDTYTDWGHNTKEMDGDLDLNYMYQRWYDSKIGLFVSSAPYPPFLEHSYSFVIQNPNMFIDQKGTTTISISID